MTTATALPDVSNRTSLVTRFASRFGVDANKLLTTLKATAFKVRDGEVTNEQMMALLVVADQYRLNPFTRELFAFPDKGGIVPVVSVDGWSRIMNEAPGFDGIEFVDGPESDGVPEWIEAVIYHKERGHPVRIRERFREVKRDTIPWKTHPARMLRHKAMIQCVRVAFGFAGIYDEDEARRIIEAREVEDVGGATNNLDAIKHVLRSREPEAAIDAQPEPTAAPETVIVGTRQGTAPTHDDIAAAIDKAQTASDLDLCADLTRSHKDDAERGQLALRLDKRRDELASKRK